MVKCTALIDDDCADIICYLQLYTVLLVGSCHHRGGSCSISVYFFSVCLYCIARRMILEYTTSFKAKKIMSYEDGILLNDNSLARFRVV